MDFPCSICVVLYPLDASVSAELLANTLEDISRSNGAAAGLHLSVHPASGAAQLLSQMDLSVPTQHVAYPPDGPEMASFDMYFLIAHVGDTEAVQTYRHYLRHVGANAVLIVIPKRT